MKLKKILAGALVAAMVLTGIPTSGIQVFAWDNDILTSSYTGYQNIDLYTSGESKKVEVTGGSNQTGNEFELLLDNTFHGDWYTRWGEKCLGNDSKNWVNFHLSAPKTVAGVVYLIHAGSGAKMQRAKVEISTDGGTTYKEAINEQI